MMGKDRRRQTGRIGERSARWLLRRRLYRILESNYTCPVGEIDIVARKGSSLCFVEVRTRTGDGEHGRAAEMVTPAKQSQVVRTARYYLHNKRIEDVDVRFHVVGITLNKSGKVVHRELIPDAFDAEI